MADWKQITARIRRARTGKDPAAQLSNLYQKTRDAMVAFELAKYFETAGQNGEAAKWYSTAAERFRRADWKTKAQEAAVRLGGDAPVTDASQSDELPVTPPILSAPEPDLPFEQNAATFEAMVTPAAEASGGTLSGQYGLPAGQATGTRAAAVVSAGRPPYNSSSHVPQRRGRDVRGGS